MSVSCPLGVRLHTMAHLRIFRAIFYMLACLLNSLPDFVIKQRRVSQTLERSILMITDDPNSPHLEITNWIYQVNKMVRIILKKLKQRKHFMNEYRKCWLKVVVENSHITLKCNFHFLNLYTAALFRHKTVNIQIQNKYKYCTNVPQ